MTFNWMVFVVFMVGLGIGALLVVCYIGWLYELREYRWHKMQQDPDSTRMATPLHDEPLRPLDAHHPAVMRDAQRRADAARREAQRQIQKDIDNRKDWGRR